jgi:two-component system response regulator CpxR
MLTSRGDETDRIVGLEMGADDYLPKTFSTRELLARLRAVIRRTRPPRDTDADGPKENELLTSDGLIVDTGSREASLDGGPVELTPIEFVMLVRLMESAGRIMSRQQLLDHVADRQYEVFDRSIDMHVSSLRKKLGEKPRSPRFIKTVRAAGYMFIGKVKR